MLRKLLKYMIVVIAPLLAACNDGFVEETDTANGNDMLTIFLRSSNATRADGYSDTDDSKNNEDAINNVFIAFYPNQYGEDTEPLAVFKPGELTLTGSNASVSVSVKMTPDLINTLFSDTDGASCKFFALANLTADEQNSIGENPTISQLKSLSIGSEFATKAVQDMFVMSGGGTATYRKVSVRNKYATGSGTLTRTAARITLNVSLDPHEITDSQGNTWTPLTTGDNIRVLLNKGVKNSIVNPTSDPAEDDYFSVGLGQSAVVRNLNGSGDGPYSMSVPFYSYPNKWDNDDSEEQNRTTMTLVMRWQRETGTGTTTRTFYYQVPVTPNAELVSNHSYQVNLTVGMLGSLTPDTAVEIDNVTYQVVNWGSVGVDVELSDTRYLIVNPTSFEVDNEASFRIPFYSTHDVEITDISVSYQLFNFYSGTQGNLATITINKTAIDNSNDRATDGSKFCDYDIVYDTTTKQYYISINHPLKIYTPYNSSGNEIPMTKNTYGSVEPATVSSNISYLTATTDDAFSVFTITVKIKHKDNDSFSDTVEITQYPGMYITPKTNPGGSYYSRYVSGYTSGNYLGNSSNNNYSSYGLYDFGYAYVNPQETTIGNITYIINDVSLGGLTPLEGATGKNPNMYVVTITQLSGDNYVIGDPRLTSINNTLASDNNGNLEESNSSAATWNNSAPALYGDSPRRLTYYYPTDESAATENMIAPKFRIASQYGALGKGVQSTSHVTKVNARKRMATYQEQDCPAGRWRLPTKAELLYMINLQLNHYIPDLFNLDTSSGYVTAQGAFVYDNKTKELKESTATYFYVRGVYDEWYWENVKNYVLKPTEDNVYNYTLGDVPRDATRSANLIKAYNDKISGK